MWPLVVLFLPIFVILALFGNLWIVGMVVIIFFTVVLLHFLRFVLRRMDANRRRSCITAVAYASNFLACVAFIAEDFWEKEKDNDNYSCPDRAGLFPSLFESCQPNCKQWKVLMHTIISLETWILLSLKYLDRQNHGFPMGWPLGTAFVPSYIHLIFSIMEAIIVKECGMVFNANMHLTMSFVNGYSSFVGTSIELVDYFGNEDITQRVNTRRDNTRGDVYVQVSDNDDADQASVENRELKQRLEMVQNEKEQVEKLMKKIEKRKKNIEGEIRRRLTELSAENNSLKDKNITLKAEVQKLKREMENEITRVTSRSKRYKSWLIESRSGTSISISMKKDLSNALEANKTLKDELKTSRDGLRKTQKELSEVWDAKITLNDDLAEKKEEINRLTLRCKRYMRLLVEKVLDNDSAGGLHEIRLGSEWDFDPGWLEVGLGYLNAWGSDVEDYSL